MKKSEIVKKIFEEEYQKRFQQIEERKESEEKEDE